MAETGARNWQSRKIVVTVIIFAGIILLILPLYGSDYLFTLAIVAFHFVYLSQSWNLIFGYCGQVALGHGLFYGVSGYFSTMLFLDAGVTPYLGGILGSLIAAVIAALFGMVLFRTKLRGLYFALVTIASAEIGKALACSWRYLGSTRGIILPLSDAPKDFFFMSRVPYFYIALSMCIGMVFLTFLIQKSTLGYRAIAIRENEEAAEASGIDCWSIKLQMFVISAFCTGLAGTFYAQFSLFIDPEVMFGFTVLLLPMLGVIVGGRGTIFGPVIGSFAFSIFGQILRSIPFLRGPQVAAVTMMVYGLALTIISIRYYGGLMAIINEMRLNRG
jgi:branched-chain amino acid transport system permease protein